MRLAEIDRLKGLAILGVMVIHSEALNGTLAYSLVVNRAVPVFLVLFGMTSSLWWHTRSSAGRYPTIYDWARDRLSRLMLPVWGTLLLWWPVQLLLAEVPVKHVGAVVATFLGYTPWIGTGWFVTLVLELVLLFPLVRVSALLLGSLPMAVAGLLVTLACYQNVFPIIQLVKTLLLDSSPTGSFFYLWIFAPIYSWHVFAGVYLAEAWPRRRVVLVVLSILVLCVLSVPRAANLVPSSLMTSVNAAADVPLAIVLLYLMGRLRPMGVLDKALSWCGRYSWGLYLAQMLVHSVATTIGYLPAERPSLERWLYFALLLVSSNLIARYGEIIRIRLAALLPRFAGEGSQEG